jgi:DNA-binding LacI/PurR family transcriptional regulator
METKIAVPNRLPLALQVAESIREGIERQFWTEFLPGERRLCELLRVSRPIVSAALRVLAKEGLIKIEHGRRNQILTRRPRKPAARNRLVVIFTHEPLTLMASTSVYSVTEMRAHLAEQGFLTEIFVCRDRGIGTQHVKLEAFLRQTSVFCCVLVSLRQDLQQWFARHSIPALVLGSCHASVTLPSFDVDYRAVCRHAGGVFRSKGHRRIALIVPDNGGAGEIASEKGFLEAVEHSTDAEAAIVRHDGTAENISTKLNILFNSAKPPTALLVAKPQHVFAVAIYLLKRGLSVPDTVSLIARDQDNMFVNVSPPIAHYRMVDGAFSRRLANLMLQLVNHGRLPPKSNLIFPRFVPGGTVRNLR